MTIKIVLFLKRLAKEPRILSKGYSKGVVFRARRAAKGGEGLGDEKNGAEGTIPPPFPVQS